MKKLIGIGIVLLAGSVVQVASAGNKLNQLVGVNTASRLAYGAIGNARNTTDTVQYITCGLSTSAPGGALRVSCYAVNSAGTQGSCTSTDSSMVEVAKALTADAYIQFNWDANGACSTLSIVTSSRYAPRQL